MKDRMSRREFGTRASAIIALAAAGLPVPFKSASAAGEPYSQILNIALGLFSDNESTDAASLNTRILLETQKKLSAISNQIKAQNTVLEVIVKQLDELERHQRIIVQEQSAEDRNDDVIAAVEVFQTTLARFKEGKSNSEDLYQNQSLENDLKLITDRRTSLSRKGMLYCVTLASACKAEVLGYQLIGFPASAEASAKWYADVLSQFLDETRDQNLIALEADLRKLRDKAWVDLISILLNGGLIPSTGVHGEMSFEPQLSTAQLSSYELPDGMAFKHIPAEKYNSPILDFDEKTALNNLPFLHAKFVKTHGTTSSDPKIRTRLDQKAAEEAKEYFSDNELTPLRIIEWSSYQPSVFNNHLCGNWMHAQVPGQPTHWDFPPQGTNPFPGYGEFKNSNSFAQSFFSGVEPNCDMHDVFVYPDDFGPYYNSYHGISATQPRGYDGRTRPWNVATGIRFRVIRRYKDVSAKLDIDNEQLKVDDTQKLPADWNLDTSYPSFSLHFSSREQLNGSHALLRGEGSAASIEEMRLKYPSRSSLPAVSINNLGYLSVDVFHHDGNISLSYLTALTQDANISSEWMHKEKSILDGVNANLPEAHQYHLSDFIQSEYANSLDQLAKRTSDMARDTLYAQYSVFITRRALEFCKSFLARQAVK